MKKDILLVLTVPAMLLAASCGTSIDHKTSVMKSSTNEGEQSLVSIACKDCLIKEKDSTEEARNAIYKKYNVDADLNFTVTCDSESDEYELPSEIDFTVDGTESGSYTWTRSSDKEATLSFKVPKADKAVNVTIDANTACMEFVVDFADDSPEGRPVEFNYNGALNYIDWGDDSGKVITPAHEYKQMKTYTVKVYGDLSSVWFTDKAEPTSNSGVLGRGNHFITSLNIRHTIKNLPNYAFNGCQGLATAYIGHSVTSMGKKVFRMNNEGEGFVKRTIYTSEFSKPQAWDDEWTDCPVCYGMSPEEMEQTYTDKDTGLLFKKLNNESGNQYAMIVGYGDDPKKIQGQPLVIPVTVDGTKYPVVSIAPYAFYGSEVAKVITGISFDTDPKISSKFVEIGDYAFKEASGSCTELNLGNIVDNGVPFKIGVGAFNRTNVTNIVFPKFGEKQGPEMIIGDKAFAEISGEPKISIPANSFRLITIGNQAFYGTTLGGFSDEDGNFPASITSIGDEAFANTKLHLDNPLFTQNVKHIGARPFMGTRVESATVSYEERPEGWAETWDALDEKGELRINVVWGFVKVIDKTSDNGLIYHVFSKNQKKTATVVKFDDSQTEVEIPESLTDSEGTYPVVAIAELTFAGSKNLTSVIVPEGVVKVGKDAFYDCNPLLKVFYKGSDISGWDPQWTSLHKKGGYTFAALYTNYSEQILSDKLVNTKFDIVKEVTPENSTYNASLLNYNAPEVAEAVTIPNTISDQNGNSYNVTSIGGKAFCKIPNPIQPGAGLDLSKGLNFSENSTITSIGTEAFGFANLPETMTLPKSIVNVGPLAFGGTAGVKTFNLASTGIKTISSYAFALSANLEEIVVPDGVKVEAAAFGASPSLTTVDLSKADMTEIPENLFAECSKYANVKGVLPTGITIIRDSAFMKTGIISADLTGYKQLKSMEANAFEECAQLSNISLPGSFESFTEGSLRSCSALTTIDLSLCSNVVEPSGALFGDTLPTAFETATSGGKIYVPSNLLEDYKKADTWAKLFSKLGEDYKNFFQVKQ